MERSMEHLEHLPGDFFQPPPKDPPAGLHQYRRMTQTPTIDAELQRALKRVVGSYLPPGPERDDLAQEVMIAVLQALPRFRGESQLNTYVLRIAHSVSLRFLSRRRTQTARHNDTDASALPATTRSPEEHLARQQRQERLLAAIRCLPLSQRQVLTLALEELPRVEIARALGISENAVNTRLHRARVQLRKHLEAP